MDFFGLTFYGSSDPFSDMVRADYIEPIAPPKNPLKAESKVKKSLSEKIKILDCYIGHADGYAYRSHERLEKMKRKYVRKPDGPIDMYNYPGTTAMEIGWWQTDTTLDSETWHKEKRYPSTKSELSRYVEICMKKDKAFRPSAY
ncbi:uncharacterized protein LOC126881336 [Diabrotica virgifera virgifera]|uniref:Uncharacterized protein n=1 Tax=Diabrotica virgifera virgifera TaxID=50390 RepID=A0ABM5JUA5_DIAVI|nr:uncharacterized protein LOC126881336 [Diabrotica virgifera virgifera]